MAELREPKLETMRFLTTARAIDFEAREPGGLDSARDGGQRARGKVDHGREEVAAGGEKVRDRAGLSRKAGVDQQLIYLSPEVLALL